MGHQELRKRRGRFGVIVAATAMLLLASCATTDQQAEPPSTSFSPTSSAAVSASPVTVPGLTTPASESPTPSPSEPAVSTEPSEEPTPEPETTEVDIPEPEPEAEATPEPDRPEPQEPPQTRDPAPQGQAATGGGRVVVIDPGHNGANGANPGTINALVDAGFGETKPCNTTGTSTNAGYSEHQFTWGVVDDCSRSCRHRASP